MNKATSRRAMAALSSLPATQALGSGYRVEVTGPSAANGTIGPGVKRAALIAFGQVMAPQFERLYPPKRYRISIITGRENRADGLAHWSTCSAKP